MNALVPLFALYGEEIWPTDLDGLHVETISSRSRLYNWEIAPHRHGDLHQVMWISEGGGLLHLEGRVLPFTAPCLMVLPAGVVHGFSWAPASEGHVLMLGADLVRGLAPPEDGGLMDRALVLEPPADLLEPLRAAMSALEAEFDRFGAGRRAGLLGGMLRLLSLIARCAQQASLAAAPLSPDAELVARFRALIEADHRAQPSLETYCRRLAVTPERLTRACRRAAGRSPLALAHERLMLEARRALTYTSMSVSQIAYALGFADAAYFSRFFSKREGVSPIAFRAGRGT